MSELEKHFQRLIELAKPYCQPGQAKKMADVIQFAINRHKGQKRASGEDYVHHCLSVAEILISWGMDYDTIVAGVLHDTIEDTNTTSEELSSRYGPTVAELVEGVTKVSKARANMKDLSNYLPQTQDNLSKLLIAVGQDIRVIIIKLADRLHNLSTLQYLAREKQIKIARESLNVFGPMADRLGMGRVRAEIEDLAFKYLDPDEYKKLSNQLKKRLGKSARKLGDIHEEVSKTLKDRGIEFEINGRVKSVYSLYRKLAKYGGDIDNIFDLIALRIIVDKKEDCYLVLGILHELYQPMISRIKDYISTPKPNGYQSLHTTVVTHHKQIVEFQIRTKQMHEYAERGLAASFFYNSQKDSKSYIKRLTSQRSLPSNLQWISQLQEVTEKIRAGEEISSEQLNIDLFSDRIFIYSPKGDIFVLPESALPLDFAYLVHTDIGKHAYGFRVNGKIQPFDKPLQNGDVVEVLTKKSSKPKSDWRNLVITSHARDKLNQQLKSQQKSQ